MLSGQVALDDFAEARLSVPRVKIIADGSIQGYTGYLTEPYYVPFKGTVLIVVIRRSPARHFPRQVGLYERRIPVAIHCNGDAFDR